MTGRKHHFLKENFLPIQESGQLKFIATPEITLEQRIVFLKKHLTTI